MRLLGKVAVVTGAAVGLGRAITTRFAQEGASVVAADTNVAEGEELVRDLSEHGHNAMFVEADVANDDAVQNLFAAAFARYKHIDVLCNNAAILLYDRDSEAHELSLDTWDNVMNVNLRGSFLCTKHAIPLMLNNGGGSIVYMGSPTGLYGCAPKLTAYSASKAGVMGLARVTAVAYAQKNIRVNAIVPGTMETPMNHSVLSDQESRDQLSRAVPLGRLGQPDDIAGLAVFLASDESAYCTGGFYMCDGGLTAV
jgi:NAD(P)-dependent dehydrogenase (short-subunit alcohol dehydrogenase family)